MPPRRKAEASAPQVQTIESVTADINEKHGPGTVVRASEARLIRPRISTGSIAFDVALGGGLPATQWTEIVGRESNGKTTFAMKAIADNQAKNPDFMALWAAAEEFDTLRARQLGIDLSRVYLIEDNTMEPVFSIALDYIEKRMVDICVIDSLAVMMPEAEDEGEAGARNPGRAAQLVNQFMRKMTKASRRSLIDDDRPCAGILINQWRSKIGVMFGDPRTTYGGEGKNYWMHERIEVRREEWRQEGEKNKKFDVGLAINVNPFKNKTFRPRLTIGMTTDFYFADTEDGLFERGEYDVGKAYLEMGQYAGVIDKRAGGYDYDGVFYRGLPAFRQVIRSEPDLAARLHRQILEAVNPDEYKPAPVAAPVVARRRRK